jgi:ketol-acid reductoisomerase
VDIEDAVARADEVFVLLSDSVIPGCFAERIAPRLRAGSAICFASGYALAYKLITPPAGVDVLMIAPRMSGAGVRECHQSKTGFVSYVSVEVDATGRARDRLLALAHGFGALRGAAVEVTAEREALVDLLVEQTFGVYLGLAMQTAFHSGVEAGIAPEVMALELYMSGEMARTMQDFADRGFFASLTNHGLTALYGGFLRTSEVDIAAMQGMFRAAIEDIRNGGFAEKFQREQADGMPTITAIRELIKGDDPMSRAEQSVRAALAGS